MDMSRTSFGYTPMVRPDEELIRSRLKKLSETRRRFGCPRLHVMLLREGFMINHKRTERIYRQEGLALRIRRRKKMAFEDRDTEAGLRSSYMEHGLYER
jgi:putative transposase